MPFRFGDLHLPALGLKLVDPAFDVGPHSAAAPGPKREDGQFDRFLIPFRGRNVELRQPDSIVGLAFLPGLGGIEHEPFGMAFVGFDHVLFGIGGRPGGFVVFGRLGGGLRLGLFLSRGRAHRQQQASRQDRQPEDCSESGHWDILSKSGGFPNRRFGRVVNQSAGRSGSSYSWSTAPKECRKCRSLAETVFSGPTISRK